MNAQEQLDEEKKKEFGEKLAEELFSQKFWIWKVGSPATLKSDVSYTDVWQWIEQYAIEQRIDKNKCEECSKELGSGTVFCSADCRIHYYRC